MHLSALQILGCALILPFAPLGCSRAGTTEVELARYAQNWVGNADPTGAIADETILRFLVGNVKRGAADFQGEGCNALHVVAKLNNYESCARFVAGGAEMAAEAKVTWLEPGNEPLVRSAKHIGTPLQSAAEWGSANALRALLDAGANANQMDRWGNSVLAIAAAAGSSEVITLLVEAGADVNSVNPRNGMTPLLWAAMNGHANTAEVLLSYGADLNARERHGKSALHLAAQGNHLKTVEMLLEHGAEVSLRDYPSDDRLNLKGNTPAEMATDDAVRRLIRSHQQEE